jgi:predicted metal-binding protein
LPSACCGRGSREPAQKLRRRIDGWLELVSQSNTQPDATIFVCVSCRRRLGDAGEAFDEPGRQLVAALEKHIAETGTAHIKVEPVECLAVCKRPCTLAITASGKWTYLIGDLDPELHIEEIAAAAVSYQCSEQGIVPWKERPPTFRRGVISRVPPLGFKQPLPETA